MKAKDKIKKHITELVISQSKLTELVSLVFGMVNGILNSNQKLLSNTLAGDGRRNTVALKGYTCLVN